MVVRLRPIGIIGARFVPASRAISIMRPRRVLEIVERHVVGAVRLVVLNERVADGQDARAADVLAAAALAHREVEQRGRLHLHGDDVATAHL